MSPRSECTYYTYVCTHFIVIYMYLEQIIRTAMMSRVCGRDYSLPTCDDDGAIIFSPLCGMWWEIGSKSRKRREFVCFCFGKVNNKTTRFKWKVPFYPLLTNSWKNNRGKYFWPFSGIPSSSFAGSCCPRAHIQTALQCRRGRFVYVLQSYSEAWLVPVTTWPSVSQL